MAVYLVIYVSFVSDTFSTVKISFSVSFLQTSSETSQRKLPEWFAKGNETLAVTSKKSMDKTKKKGLFS